MADELINGGPDGGQQAAQAPPAAPASTPAAPPATPPAPQEPAQGTPHPGEFQPTPAAAAPAPGEGPQPSPTTPAAGSAAAAQQAQWQSARDYARAMGFDPGQAADDASFLQNLMAQARQSQHLQQQALAYQRALMLQGQQQAQPAAAPPAKKPGFWNPPEWNQSWDALLTKDDKGNVALLPGAPPEILGKHLAYQQYRRDFADRLLSNPAEALKPLITEQAQQIAQEIAGNQLRQAQDQAHVNSFLAQNSGWLHQRDGQGGVVRDPLSGQPLLSAAGVRFRNYVVEAEQSGVRDIRAQENYARRMLQGDLAMEQLRAGQAQQQQQQGNQQVIAQNRHNPNLSGSLPRPGVPAQQPPQNAGLSLRDQLSQALAQAGMTDAQLSL